jgi:hypothetical protein
MIQEQKVIDPKVLEILKIVHGLSLEQSNKILTEVREYLENLSGNKPISTLEIVEQLKKFN